LSGEGAELGRLELCSDACYLGNTTTGQLDADDVRVGAELGEHIRVDVKTGDDAREVVDQDGNERGISKLKSRSDTGRFRSIAILASWKNSTIASSFMAKWK